MIPLVERTIPIIIENSNTNSIPMETGTTGFPFDRDFNDDNSFREKLDNIAKRHPEFAEHLSGFPFRNHSGSSNLHHRFRHEPDFSGFSPQERSFVSTSRPCFDNSEVPTQSERQSTQSEQYPQSKETSQTSGKSSTPSINDEKVKIHSSNTVDLGQKQEPEVSDRNQRSMSAPPSDNNRQTFVSSINIPITRMDNMGNQHSSTSQSEQKSHQQKSNERVIPIHVEGRDEPVFPKSNYTQHQHHQPPPPSSSSSSSQSERFFGHRPSHFSPFPKENSKFASSGCQTDFGNSNKSQQPSQSKEVPKQQPEEHNEVDSEVPLPAPEAPPPQSQPPPVPPKVEITPIDQIKSIQKDVSNLMEQVEQFNGIPKDKQYLYLDEMLTRNLIKLDNIDTQGQENIRQARREAIKCIESCISILEAKATANATALTLPPLKGPDDYINNKQNIINDKMDIDNKIENEKEKSNKESTKNIENEMEIVEINEIPNEKLINSGDDISNNNNDSNSELKMDVVDEKSDDKIKNSKKVTKKKKD